MRNDTLLPSRFLARDETALLVSWFGSIPPRRIDGTRRPRRTRQLAAVSSRNRSSLVHTAMLDMAHSYIIPNRDGKTLLSVPAAIDPFFVENPPVLHFSCGIHMSTYAASVAPLTTEYSHTAVLEYGCCRTGMHKSYEDSILPKSVTVASSSTSPPPPSYLLVVTATMI